jgi:hypothetical protein
MCERCDALKELGAEGAQVGLQVLTDGRVLVVGTVDDDAAVVMILEAAREGMERLIEDRRAARRRRLH